MDYDAVFRPGFMVAGVSARVHNDRPESFAELWQEFKEADIRASLPQRLSDEVYNLYTDYESDHTGEFTALIGYPVADGVPVPDDLDAYDVPAAHYAVIRADGPMPQAVIEAWHAIWASDLQRTYSGDFDLYRAGTGSTPGPVDIHVAINPGDGPDDGPDDGNGDA